MGIKAKICMPIFAPEIKIASVRRLGAEVILCGEDFDSARIQMQRIAEQQNLTIIPAFDDCYVIAGAGTVGVEILRQIPERLDAIFVCVGGGGLISGIAAYVKRIRPEVRIIGVNTTDSDGMKQSLEKGEPLVLPSVGLFADGTAVRGVGHENFRLCQALVDDMVCCTTDEICAAIKDTFEDTRSIVEPAGALSLAGCKKFLKNNPQITDGVFVCVLSGANMNFDRLRFVADRARMGEGKEALLHIGMPERKGAFQNLYAVIFPRNITEISYRIGTNDIAHIFLAIEKSGEQNEIATLTSELAIHGINCVDCTDDEFAKTHARYLMGGRCQAPELIKNERLFRVFFPERPGSLKHFFSLLKDQWNITLLHYRNHGSDIARVLLGIQVPPDSNECFQEILAKQSISFTEETENFVYQSFLK